MQIRLKDVILRIIARGDTEGLSDKVSVIYLNGGLNDEEYNEIMEALTPTSNED